ncbi:MAG: MMPL family transporter [Bifidobacteriaceae bacterium]|jgi:RND superfamily putative drug exporter|nr:MMPL family transporter [Bifidobacteriaceae bacterium]
MAQLLYRLGRFSAKHRFGVIGFWLIALVAAAGAYLGAHGSLAASFDIPGTATATVSAELAKRLPDLAGAAGTVVFRTGDGAQFNDDQRAQISEALGAVTTVDRVRAVVDPFLSEAERIEQQQLLEQSAAELTQGQADLDAGRAALEAAQTQLDAAQAQIDDALAAAAAAGITGPVDPQMVATLGELEAQQAELAAQREALDQAQTDLDAGAETLEDGQRLFDFASPIRTVSTEGSTALAMIMFEDDMFALPQASKELVVERIDGADIARVEVDYSSEIAQTTEGLIGPSEVIGVGVAAIVLLVLLRTLFAALTPIVSSLVGAGIGVAGSMSLSGVLDMNSITPVLGIMLGLAVGIDYALFIIQRHRRQLASGLAVPESIALATGTAGNAVVFAGSTVVIALAALGVCGIPFLSLMGWVGAACVAIAVLVAISFTPALLSLLGKRLLPRRASRAAGSAGSTEVADLPARPMSTGRAVVSVVVGIGGLLVLAIPALDMRLGLPDGSNEPTGSTSYRSYMAVAAEFGPGMNGRLVVAAELPEAASGEEAQVEAQANIAATLMDQPDVVAVVPAGVSAGGDYLAFQVVPAEGPASVSTEVLVDRLRAISPLEGGIELGVAGQASGNIDVSAKLADALPLYLVVVGGLSLLVMVVVFRSLLVPLIAAAGFVLSYFAALGAVVAIYQWGWLGFIFDVHDPGPVLNFAPILLVGVVFALAMDYQLFLASGMREAFVHGSSTRQAVMVGLHGARAVVVAAALIMMSVFGGFIFSHLAMVRPLGFGLAVGVMFDAFVVRLLVVPAVMHLAGRSAWWLPRWLDRVLPNVDLEGAALERRLSG